MCWWVELMNKDSYNEAIEEQWRFMKLKCLSSFQSFCHNQSQKYLEPLDISGCWFTLLLSQVFFVQQKSWALGEHTQTDWFLKTPASVYLCAYVKWRIWEIMTSSPQIMPCLKQQRQTIWYVLCQKLQRPNVKMSTNLNYYPSPSLVECLEFVILTETLRAPGSIIQTLWNCIEWGDNVIL